MKKIKLSNGTEITMREPKVRDIKIISKDDVSEQIKEINLIGNLCSLSPKEMDDMDYKDYKRLSEALKDFL